jgi:hypothetical protein
MKDDKGRFTKGNPGRKQGSQNKLPNKALVVQLLDKIIEDLSTNYNTLRTSEKLRIIQHFARLYEVEDLSLDNEPRFFKIEIVRNAENEETE